MGESRARRVMLAVGLVVGATACGTQPATHPSVGPTHSASATVSQPPSSTPAPTSPPTTDGNGSLVPPLPDLTKTPAVTLPKKKRAVTYGADASWPQCPRGMAIPQK